MTKNLRILIADDHDLMRRGLRALVESRPGWQVCDEAQTGREAIEKVELTKPDVVILDLSMPELNGLEAARSIRKSSPGTEILILSVHFSDQLIRDIVEAGVHGYIMKSDSDRDLISALEKLVSATQALNPIWISCPPIGSQPGNAKSYSCFQRAEAARKWLRFLASVSRPPKRIVPTS